MSRLRFWHSDGWRRILKVDSDLAEAEGLAAGTGLLTGSLVEDAALPRAECPRCSGTGEVVSIDLLDGEVVRRCRSCAQAWSERRAQRVRHAS